MTEREATALLDYAGALTRRAEAGGGPDEGSRVRAAELGFLAGLLRGAVGLKLEVRDVLAVVRNRRSDLEVSGNPGEIANESRHRVLSEVADFLAGVLGPTTIG